MCCSFMQYVGVERKVVVAFRISLWTKKMPYDYREIEAIFDQ